MQQVYTARIGSKVAGDEEEGGGGGGSSGGAPLRLTEYEIAVTPQAAYHAPNIQGKMARLLISHGLLARPDHQAHTVVVLVPDAINDDKGVKSMLSWLVPLLPAQPAAVKRLSKLGGWSLLLRAIGAAEVGGGKGVSAKHEVQVCQPDDWTVEVTRGRSEMGVDDAAIQACIAYTAQLELNRQGWSYADGRFIRTPAGLKPATSIHALQLGLTLTQQRELTICIGVQSVKFNSVSTSASVTDASDLHLAERVLKILPDLDEGQVTEAVGIANKDNSKSLGIDREMWLERYGYVLPATFPVVRAQLGLASIRSRDEAAKTKQAQEHAATVQEVVAILKSIRVAATTSSSGSLVLTSLLQANFTSRETDPLLAAINPFAKASSIDTIQSDGGFKAASQLTPSAMIDDEGEAASSKQKKAPRVQLTITPSRRRAPTSLSVLAIKATTQLPTATPLANGGGFGGGFSSAGGGTGSSSSSSSWLSSAGYGDAPKPPPSDEQLPPTFAEDESEMKHTEAKPDSEVKAKPRPTKRKEPATPTKKPSAATGSKPTTSSKVKSKTTANEPPAKKAKSSSSSKTKEIKAERDARKQSSSSSKSKSSSRKAAPWASDFTSAFSAIVSAEVVQGAAAFRQQTDATPAATSEKEQKVEVKEKKKKAAQQTKLSFAPVQPPMTDA